ncbi:branched-chain amino acid transport system II carrier protein [Virgibacillus sp. MSP4-1]|uniref:branched-chain amino acid transport system II carrier protein n=1 Tax=Virgibacillus sp. MSP4-1 TaxID=2700081 RepID=UPI0003A51DEC|nr:branched-chain amino acid transport system II carrier protein [Virgibacillus sp. MSP4-1]QHS23723.1 branched-chain amino acid transport system II carrier protein [Virgibacillus sp. MSP4-1]
MKQTLATREVFALGFFMLALFLGAGNIIFPPLLGQQAGQSLWPAIAGFLVTGVGLPLVAIITVSMAGNLDRLSQRVHPFFQVVFPFVIYLAIGPFFGIPRTATVAYEVGVQPFLSENSSLILFLSTFVFFGLTYLLALNPAKLVDRIGKMITPLLLLLIVLIAIRGFASPPGPVGEATGKYLDKAFSSGFLEGYLTMDAIAALVFGLVVINRIKDKGITDVSNIRSYTVKAGLIAGAGLSFVYLSLAFIGATSVSATGVQDNGGSILTNVTSIFFGPTGMVILALVITFACLTTSIGLVSACGEFINERFEKIPYKAVVAIICLFSFTMANLGLTQLIAVSLPVLTMIYPIAIVLIILSIINSIKAMPRIVFSGAIIGAALISLYDGLAAAGLNMVPIRNLLSYLPLFEYGAGWVLPSVAGALIALIIHGAGKAEATV